MVDDGTGMTQRELLLELRGDVKAIREELATKASAAYVKSLEHRVSSTGDRITEGYNAARTAESSLQDQISRLAGQIETINAVSKGRTALITLIVSLIVMVTVVGGLLITLVRP